MGAIIKDTRSGKVIWTIRYKDIGDRIRKERTNAVNRTLARRILSERENDVERARLQGLHTVFDLIAPKEAVSLRKFSDEYLTHVEAYCRPKTVLRYRDLLKLHLLPKLGALCLSELSAGHIQKYSDERLKDGAAPATALHELAVLSGIFREAMKRDLVDRNPVSLVKKPRVDNAIVRYLDFEEEGRLLSFAPEPLRTAILVALHTGLREGEETNLTWADVRWIERVIVVRNTKSRRDRVIPMSRGLYETLQSIPRHISSPYVFTNPETRTRYDRFNNTTWRTVLDKAGIKDFRWHDLRHSFASKLTQSGVPITTIKELMGHSTITMTMRYAHLAPSNMQEAVKVLDGGARPVRFLAKSAHGGAQSKNRIKKAVS